MTIHRRKIVGVKLSQRAAKLQECRTITVARCLPVLSEFVDIHFC
jgi:hypothetical protein